MRYLIIVLLIPSLVLAWVALAYEVSDLFLSYVAPVLIYLIEHPVDFVLVDIAVILFVILQVKRAHL
jgi:hypothetical protein